MQPQRAPRARAAAMHAVGAAAAAAGAPCACLLRRWQLCDHTGLHMSFVCCVPPSLCRSVLASRNNARKRGKQRKIIGAVYRQDHVLSLKVQQWCKDAVGTAELPAGLKSICDRCRSQAAKEVARDLTPSMPLAVDSPPGKNTRRQHRAIRYKARGKKLFSQLKPAARSARMQVLLTEVLNLRQIDFNKNVARVALDDLCSSITASLQMLHEDMERLWSRASGCTAVATALLLESASPTCTTLQNQQK